MNNLKKLSSALAGSLVASAQAGEIAVCGSANVTMVMGETANSNRSLVQTKTLCSMVQVKWTTVGFYCKYFTRCHSASFTYFTN